MRTKDTRDKPWLIRTYAGHSTAAKSNALYRANLAKGQTGLSVAFDLPTQTGYDADHVLARGEVGKVGVPVAHLGDMRTLFDGIPLAEMNTSMPLSSKRERTSAISRTPLRRENRDASNKASASMRVTVPHTVIICSFDRALASARSLTSA